MSNNQSKSDILHKFTRSKFILMKYIFIILFLSFPLAKLVSQDIKNSIDQVQQYFQSTPSKRVELFKKCKLDYQNLSTHTFNNEDIKIFKLYESLYNAILFENNSDSIVYDDLQINFTRYKNNLTSVQANELADFIIKSAKFIQEIKRYNWKNNLPFQPGNRKNKILNLFNYGNSDEIEYYIQELDKYESNPIIKDVVKRGLLIKLAMLNNDCWYDQFRKFNKEITNIIDVEYKDENPIYSNNKIDYNREVLFKYYFYDLVNTKYFIDKKNLLEILGNRSCFDLENNPDNPRKNLKNAKKSTNLDLEIMNNQFTVIVSKINSAINTGNNVSCEMWQDSVLKFLKKHNKTLKIEDSLYAIFIDKHYCYSSSKIKLDKPILIKDAPNYFTRKLIRDNDEHVIKVEIAKNTTYSDILNLYVIGIDHQEHLRIIFNRLKFYNLEILFPTCLNLHEAGVKLKKLNINDIIGTTYFYLPNLSALSLKYSNIKGDKDYNVLNFNQLQRSFK